MAFIRHRRSAPGAPAPPRETSAEITSTCDLGGQPDAIAASFLAVAIENGRAEDDGIRAHVMVFERAEGGSPILISKGLSGPNGVPVNWSAISGQVADAEEPGGSMP
ncbi:MULTISPECIES: hypothetical protein [Roseobacteraceae]|uniref:hypothetical protein n=1 Tax=Aliiruegeria sabulilitoris TaxID=1510458 RepID=UPI0012E3A95D|nr:hypothetical protein [Aliiruegeria sabulilitoris]NDR59523.1 hypothetical protein [Pseudoruegeria sp. M32A2M]